MKKINYGSFVCEVSVDPDYMLLKHGLCDYERDTIAYAVERFFTRCRKAGKACTEESIQIRVAKGKAKRKHAFMYLAPAILMELPEGWVRVWGEVKEEQPSCKQTGKPLRKPVIICGDFNVAATPMDIKNPKSNVKNAGFTPEERGKFAELLDSGFTDTFRYMHPDEVKYSWWSYRFKARERNAGWRLDYFLTSDFAKDKIEAADIHTDIMGSDHCPVSLEIDV